MTGLRGASSPLYHLLTPENRMPSRLPWFAPSVRSTLLVTPRGRRCEFSQAIVSTASEAARSEPIEPGHEHVLYLLSGAARVRTGAAELELPGPGAFAYASPSDSLTLSLGLETSLLWIRRPYAPLGERPAPASFASTRDEVAAYGLGPPGVAVRELMPSDVAFDLAINLLSFEPGAALGMVEIHDEDHGLYLLSGEGSYLLDRERFPVQAGDFIYMAPYCPQHFAATGAETAEYLLYKPANRFP